MKVKKEDLGLYFALGLVGAGVGLLVGTYIASRRGGSMPRYIPEDYQEEWDEEAEKAADKTVQKISRKKNRVKKGEIDISRRKHRAAISEKKQLEKDLEEFIDKYQPTAIQIEMVKSDLIGLKELEDMMMKEELAKHTEPYDYNGPYLEDGKPELSDLSKLPEEEDVIDDRYKILQEPPKRKSPKNMRVVYFDSEAGSFYTMTRQKQPIAVNSIEEFITEETWEIMLPYMVTGFAPLFVNDLQTAKWYRFEIVPEDMEESSGHEDASYE